VQPDTYEITITGQAGKTLRAQFDDCNVTAGPDTTTLRAELPDPAALSGLVQRIAGLGPEVIHLHRVTPRPIAPWGSAMYESPRAPLTAVPARLTQPVPGQDHADHRPGPQVPGLAGT
jgi:hypothetical protein